MQKIRLYFQVCFPVDTVQKTVTHFVLLKHLFCITSNVVVNLLFADKKMRVSHKIWFLLLFKYVFRC
jgi:hypothetical protein